MRNLHGLVMAGWRTRWRSPAVVAGETRLATIYGIVAAVNPIVLIILELNENH